MTVTVTFPMKIGPAAVGHYTVAYFQHGVAVQNPISIDDLSALSKLWKRRGWNLFDVGISVALGASIVATSAKGSKLWRAELDASARERAGGDDELAWMLGCDTGYSAMVMLIALGSSETARGLAKARLGDLRPPPGDPDDLGRCIRLLDRFPAWRDLSWECLADVPGWEPLLRAWSELEALYRSEVGSGTAPRTYARMRELEAGR